MKMSLVGGVAALLVLASAQGAEISVASPDDYRSQNFKNRTHLIDPDQEVYGVPFGATEADITKAFGPPNGIYQMSEDRRALLYGKSHAFVLKAGKFRELYVADSIFDWSFAAHLEGHPFFDGSGWEIRPGLRERMDYLKIKSLVGDILGDPKYEAAYTTDHATVTLRFATHSEPNSASQYQLYSFSIRHH